MRMMKQFIGVASAALLGGVMAHAQQAEPAPDIIKQACTNVATYGDLKNCADQFSASLSDQGAVFGAVAETLSQEDYNRFTDAAAENNALPLCIQAEEFYRGYNDNVAVPMNAGDLNVLAAADPAHKALLSDFMMMASLCTIDLTNRAADAVPAFAEIRAAAMTVLNDGLQAGIRLGQP